MALADDIFAGFDVSDDDKPFLLGVLRAPGTPWEEKLAIYDLGLLSGYEDWNLMLESAAAMKDRDLTRSPLDAQDILAYIPRVKEATLADAKLRQGWTATDQSIKNLAALLRVHRPGHAVESQPRHLSQPTAIKRERAIKREVPPPKRGRVDDEDDDDDETEPKRRVKRPRTAPKPSTSHYFADEQPPRTNPEQQTATPSSADTSQIVTSALISNGIATPNPTPRKQSRETAALKEGTTTGRGTPRPNDVKTQNGGAAASKTNDENSSALKASGPQTAGVREVAPPEPSPRRKTAVKSPFFGQPQSRPSPRSKRPGGLVSTIPFPPLSAPRFGLIQEEFAHEPFWLLVVVTFLVKTAGTLAIPAFYKVKERFPTPTALADPEATTPIVSMIHHLGLSVVRTAAIQRYARLWLERPPTAGTVYRVKNYDKRDVELETPRPDVGDSQELTPGRSGEAGEAWEMGHLTQGKYALDSWRIFCRDELLGRAEDWNGKGAAPNFQPEWMRVRPDDKELRACLRWMWMREGWEWDPVTGEKTVLRDEMRRAANEGRVQPRLDIKFWLIPAPQNDVDRRAAEAFLSSSGRQQQQQQQQQQQYDAKRLQTIDLLGAIPFQPPPPLSLQSRMGAPHLLHAQIDSEDEFTVLVTGFGPFKAQYPVNPSWEIARSLPAYLPPLRAKNPKEHHHPSASSSSSSSSAAAAASRPLPPVRILVHPEAIRVNYMTVRALVPRLWDPALHPRVDAVVHIGMAGPRLFYSVERRGHRDGYTFPDVDGRRLEDDERRREEGDGWVWHGMPPEIETGLDLADVLERWKAHSPVRDKLLTAAAAAAAGEQEGSDLRISEDAGHYLCDFIYFSSLAHLWRAREHRRVTFLHVPSDASEASVARGTELAVQLIRSIAESELRRRRDRTGGPEDEVVAKDDKIAVELRV
ncbi:hypothetical protein LZ31DRAFT_537764 [Colletotrichum somersetense]|nr:hypothetical protein LZ31DRAFT_537764 [Colletotrichum somersetense]